MGKSIYTKDYKQFLSLLKQARQSRGISQEALAEMLGQTQSFVSKCERGERRLDLIEARRFAKAIGIPLADLVDKLERKLRGSK